MSFPDTESIARHSISFTVTHLTLLAFVIKRGGYITPHPFTSSFFRQGIDQALVDCIRYFNLPPSSPNFLHPDHTRETFRWFQSHCDLCRGV